jgi:hypothetical protein
MPRLGLKEVSRRTARAVESVLIKYVLEEVRGNRVEAARRLQISYKALLYKIEMYQLGNSRPARRLDAHFGWPGPESRSSTTNGNAIQSPPETS